MLIIGDELLRLPSQLIEPALQGLGLELQIGRISSHVFVKLECRLCVLNGNGRLRQLLTFEGLLETKHEASQVLRRLVFRLEPCLFAVTYLHRQSGQGPNAARRQNILLAGDECVD